MRKEVDVRDDPRRENCKGIEKLYEYMKETERVCVRIYDMYIILPLELSYSPLPLSALRFAVSIP